MGASVIKTDESLKDFWGFPLAQMRKNRRKVGPFIEMKNAPLATF